MVELKRAQCSQQGYRMYLKRILASADEILANPSPLSEESIATLRDLHDQIQRKHDLITPLDARILKATVEDEAIESEVLQAEETNIAISTAKAKISHRLSSIPTRATTTPFHPTSIPTTDHHEGRVTRLPKLELPQFCGNPLTWQSFWDCFEASIHTNDNLTAVQRLSYLRSQLQGEARRVIAGFPLTN